MSFRFHYLLALAISLLVIASEAGAAQACRQLFRASAQTSLQTLALLQQIRGADPVDVAPLLAELGHEISVQKFSDADLRFILSAVFRKTKNARFSQASRIFTSDSTRRDLILARYQRTLLSEVADGEQRGRVVDLLASVTFRNQY